jgi:hypothetical protein
MESPKVGQAMGACKIRNMERGMLWRSVVGMDCGDIEEEDDNGDDDEGIDLKKERKKEGALRRRGRRDGGRAKKEKKEKKERRRREGTCEESAKCATRYSAVYGRDGRKEAIPSTGESGIQPHGWKGIRESGNQGM